MAFDSLIAKLICHSNSDLFLDAVNLSKRALSEFNIEGVDTNIEFHLNLLSHPEFISGNINTLFLDDNLGELIPDESASSEEISTGQPSKPSVTCHTQIP